jgi:hypothetical protein
VLSHSRLKYRTSSGSNPEATRQGLPMDDLDTARRYHCARCHQPVILCRNCDRGNIYCFDGCAQAANKERCKRNAKRYRRSPKGRRGTAARQRSKRLRQAMLESDPESSKQHQHTPEPASPELSATPCDSSIVTHRGSVDEPGGAPLLPKPMQPRAVYCNACHRCCNEAMRVDFLRTPRHRSRHRTRNGTLP